MTFCLFPALLMGFIPAKPLFSSFFNWVSHFHLIKSTRCIHTRLHKLGKKMKQCLRSLQTIQTKQEQQKKMKNLYCHSRPCCELEHFEDYINASGYLPYEQNDIQCVQGNVQTPGRLISLLHCRNKSCCRCP